MSILFSTSTSFIQTILCFRYLLLQVYILLIIIYETVEINNWLSFTILFTNLQKLKHAHTVTSVGICGCHFGKVRSHYLAFVVPLNLLQMKRQAMNKNVEINRLLAQNMMQKHDSVHIMFSLIFFSCTQNVAMNHPITQNSIFQKILKVGLW